MKTLTQEKKCPECGSGDFTLCEDFTRYSCVESVDGELRARFDHEEAEDYSFDPLGGRRLLCVGCGEYVEVPEGL